MWWLHLGFQAMRTAYTSQQLEGRSRSDQARARTFWLERHDGESRDRWPNTCKATGVIPQKDLAQRARRVERSAKRRAKSRRPTSPARTEPPPHAWSNERAPRDVSEPRAKSSRSSAQRARVTRRYGIIESSQLVTRSSESVCSKSMRGCVVGSRWLRPVADRWLGFDMRLRAIDAKQRPALAGDTLDRSVPWRPRLRRVGALVACLPHCAGPASAAAT